MGSNPTPSAIVVGGRSSFTPDREVTVGSALIWPAGLARRPRVLHGNHCTIVTATWTTARFLQRRNARRPTAVAVMFGHMRRSIATSGAAA